MYVRKALYSFLVSERLSYWQSVDDVDGLIIKLHVQF